MSKTKDSITKLIKDNNIQVVNLLFCDIFSKLKNISISPDLLVDAIDKGIEIDSSAINGFKTDKEQPLLIFPDPDTILLIPYKVNSLICYCNIKYSNGEDFNGDLRSVLKNTINSFRTQDIDLKIGFECEFYLFKLDEFGNETLIPYDDASYLDTPPEDKCLPIRRKITNILDSLEVRTLMSYHAKGPGQNKIILDAVDPLKAADNFLTFKFVANLVAENNNLCVSYSPKPIKSRESNNLNINIYPYVGDVNILESADENYTNDIKQFKNYLAKRLSEISIFLNPVNESYERLNTTFRQRGSTWSDKLTSESFIIESRDKIQLTSPDMESNPYIVLSLIMQAGFDDSAVQAIDNIKQIPKINISIPSSYKSAIDTARSSQFLGSVLPDEILTPFFFIKNSELEEN